MSQHIKNSISNCKTGWKLPIILVLLLFACQAIAIETPREGQTHNATHGIHVVRYHEAKQNLNPPLNASTLLVAANGNATIEQSDSLQLAQGQYTFAMAPSNTSTYSVLLSTSDYLSRVMSNAIDEPSSSSTSTTQWPTSTSMVDTDTTSEANTLFSSTTPPDITPTSHITPTATEGGPAASQPHMSGMSTKETVVIAVGLTSFLVIMFVMAVVICGAKLGPTEINWLPDVHELQAMRR